MQSSSIGSTLLVRFIVKVFISAVFCHVEWLVTLYKLVSPKRQASVSTHCWGGKANEDARAVKDETLYMICRVGKFTVVGRVVMLHFICLTGSRVRRN
jgi:hypothetical protein